MHRRTFLARLLHALGMATVCINRPVARPEPEAVECPPTVGRRPVEWRGEKYYPAVATNCITGEKTICWFVQR